MGILDSLYSPNLDAVNSAMRLSTQRQSLLMANLANVNTPGYKRKDIDFNLSLDEAMGDPSGAQVRDMQDEDRQAQSDQTSLTSDGNNVDLEREVQGIAETQLRYTALAQIATNYFTDLKSAIREGK